MSVRFLKHNQSSENLSYGKVRKFVSIGFQLQVLCNSPTEKQLIKTAPLRRLHMNWSGLKCILLISLALQGNSALCYAKIHVFPSINTAYNLKKTIKRLEYHRNNALFIAKAFYMHTQGHSLKAKAPCVQKSFQFSLCPERGLCGGERTS